MKIVGVALSAGEFQGRKYDNVNVHCLEEPSNFDRCVGQACVIVKVKREIFNNFASSYMTAGSGASVYFELIGLDVDFSYDRYNNVKSVVFG